MLWLQANGVRFLPAFGRQSFRVGGRNIFWGGLTVETAGGGAGLVDSLFRRAQELGVEVRYDSKVTALEGDRHAVSGVRLGGELVEADV